MAAAENDHNVNSPKLRKEVSLFVDADHLVFKIERINQSSEKFVLKIITTKKTSVEIIQPADKQKIQRKFLPQIIAYSFFSFSDCQLHLQSVYDDQRLVVSR